jgi:hypothetical protein
MRHVNDSFDPEDRRQARLVMLGLGLSFVAMCVGYVMLAAGNLLG